MSWLGQIAPTIATALGGPLAGMATELIGKTLGISSDEVTKAINSNKLTADQVAGLQQAELALKAKAQEMSLDFETLATQDKKSAREMQMSVKSMIPPILAIGITIGFFGIMLGMMSGQVQSSEALMIMLGSLGTAWTGVISFYFGSSASSQAKDQLIHNSTPIKWLEMTQLTNHFTLEELTVTDHRTLDNTPNFQERANLQRMAEFLEKVKELLGGKPIMINSSFRSKAVNDACGSKDSSQHRVGCAADIRVPGMTPDEVVKAIIASDLPYDQCIREFDRWTHVSIPNDLQHEPRHMSLIIDKSGTRVYS
jgi:zinc D-Ala-D-Ala carboxypeptidase